MAPYRSFHVKPVKMPSLQVSILERTSEKLRLTRALCPFTPSYATFMYANLTHYRASMKICPCVSIVICILRILVLCCLLSAVRDAQFPTSRTGPILLR